MAFVAWGLLTRRMGNSCPWIHHWLDPCIILPGLYCHMIQFVLFILYYGRYIWPLATSVEALISDSPDVQSSRLQVGLTFVTQ